MYEQEETMAQTQQNPNRLLSCINAQGVVQRKHQAVEEN